MSAFPPAACTSTSWTNATGEFVQSTRIDVDTNLASVSNRQVCAKIGKSSKFAVACLNNSFVKKLHGSLVKIKPQWHEEKKSLTSIICHKINEMN